MTHDTNIPQGYKATALGIIPQEWEVKSLNKACDFLDSQRIPIKDSERAKISGIYPYYGASGIIDYVNNYIFNDDLILLAEDGANIINRSTPIAFLVNGKIWVNNHAHVLKAKPSFDRYYLCAYLESLKYDKYNTGTAQPKLNREVCEKIPVLAPPLAEQRKIAEVLGVWDEAIEKQARLIEKLALRKRALMQRLLSAKLRLPGFSEKWEEVELGEVLSYEQPTPYIVRDTNYQNNYKTPVLTAGKTFILGYTNEGNGICKNIPVILFDDFTTDSRYIDFEFKVKSSATKLLRAKGQNNLYFIFCALQCFKYPIGGHERHWISKFQYLTIALPSIEEQTAIAEVLTAADREIELAKEKLERLRRQKRGLMQQLLTGKKRIK